MNQSGGTSGRKSGNTSGGDYQNDLSIHSPILLDRDYKRPKVEKLLAVLADAGLLGDGTGGLAVDVGCSRGFFAEALAPHFAEVLGVDIDPHALRLAHESRDESSPHYLRGDSLNLPLPDASVDLVICNHVYEHVPSAEALFAEIRRVLRVGGMCYLGAASRLTPVEPHYHLPFLSWLPKWLADPYMRVSGKGDRYYENLRTYWGIRRLISEFEVLDYTLKIVEDPDTFRARDLFPKGSLVARMPLWLWRACYPLLPSYIFLLKKT